MFCISFLVRLLNCLVVLQVDNGSLLLSLSFSPTHSFSPRFFLFGPIAFFSNISQIRHRLPFSRPPWVMHLFPTSSHPIPNGPYHQLLPVFSFVSPQDPTLHNIHSFFSPLFSPLSFHSTPHRLPGVPFLFLPTYFFLVTAAIVRFKQITPSRFFFFFAI